MASDSTSVEGPGGNRWGVFLRNTDLFFTFALFGIITLLILPVAPVFLDIFLAASIGLSLLVLLVVIYLRDPTEFSIFPTMLLAVTLFRLGLNVASTRLILVEGYAGNIIQSFGDFVVQGNYVVGVVVFCILVVINFVVITKGAGRIAEVTARFTLDAMPGKQMAIDAELNAGLIDEVTAGQRRQKIQKEADFYGAMDGASKFVRGDAVAGILITLINIVGGIAIGAWQKGLPLMDAMQKYTLLSIGDGLVSQIPALIVSVGAGMLVTRTATGSNLGSEIGRQLAIYPRALAIAGGMLLIFAIVPGLPTLPFGMLGAGCLGAAWLLDKKGIAEKARSSLQLANSDQPALPGGASVAAETADADKPHPGSIEELQTMIGTDRFAIELGFNLLSLASEADNGDLLQRITGVRQKFARELGLIVPPLAVRDNLELEGNEYRFLLRGKELARARLEPKRWLAMNVSDSPTELKGTPTVEPVFGLEAVWVSDDERKNAEIHGFTVVDAGSVLITHLSEVLRVQAHQLIEREDVQKLIDAIKEKNATLVNELLPDLVSVGLIQRVLQNLLQEQVPIRNLTLILETIADYAPLTKSADELSEQARRRLGPYFIQQMNDEQGQLPALTLEPRLEQALATRVKRTQFEVGLMMDPDLTGLILEQLGSRVKQLTDEGQEAILVTTTEVRLAFRRFFEPNFPRLTVLAYQEIPGETEVRNLGVIAAPLPRAPEGPAGQPAAQAVPA